MRNFPPSIQWKAFLSDDKNSISRKAAKEIKMSHSIAHRETFKQKNYFWHLYFLHHEKNPKKSFRNRIIFRFKKNFLHPPIPFPGLTHSKDIKCKNEITTKRNLNKLVVLVLMTSFFARFSGTCVWFSIY